VGLIEKCRRDPFLFGRDVLGCNRWGRQNEIHLSVRENRRTVSDSANGVGKTWEFAATAIEFLITHPYSRAFFIGPSFHQVRDGLWSEFIKCWYAAERHGFRLSAKPPGDGHWRIREGWDAAIAAVDNISSLHGRRGQAVLVIFDEGQGIENLDLIDAADSLLQDPVSRMLAGGNPLDPQGFLHDICEGNASKQWNRIRIDGFEHPNIGAPFDPAVGPTEDWVKAGKSLIPGSITRLWVSEKWDLWGEDDPRYMARVRGRFPPAGQWQLIPPGLLEQCEGITPDINEQKRAGMDCARNPGTGDRNVIVVLDEHRVQIDEVGWHSADTMASAEVLIDKMEAHKIRPEWVGVDVTGIGSGVVDRCRQRGYPVKAIDFGGSATGRWRSVIGKDANHEMIKPELHDVCRALLRKKLISIPRKFRKTRDDLTELRFGYKNGRMVIEDKEKFRQRVGRSPDYSDALVIALAATGYVPLVG
jgi:hypothetical protein